MGQDLLISLDEWRSSKMGSVLLQEAVLTHFCACLRKEARMQLLSHVGGEKPAAACRAASGCRIALKMVASEVVVTWRRSQRLCRLGLRFAANTTLQPLRLQRLLQKPTVWKHFLLASHDNATYPVAAVRVCRQQHMRAGGERGSSWPGSGLHHTSIVVHLALA